MLLNESIGGYVDLKPIGSLKKENIEEAKPRNAVFAKAGKGEMQPRTVGGWTNPDGSINDPAASKPKPYQPSLKFRGDDNELSGFTTKPNKSAQRPSLENLQFLADLKLKRLGTITPAYGRISVGAEGEANKLIKIYNDADKLLDYFTRK
jgi:hypothetical protein